MDLPTPSYSTPLHYDEGRSLGLIKLTLQHPSTEIYGAKRDGCDHTPAPFVLERFPVRISGGSPLFAIGKLP